MSRYRSPSAHGFTAGPDITALGPPEDDGGRSETPDDLGSLDSAATQSSLAGVPESPGQDEIDTCDRFSRGYYSEAEFYHYHLLSFVDLLERGIGKPDTIKIAVRAIGDVAIRVVQAKQQNFCNWDPCNRVMLLMVELIDGLLESLQAQYDRHLDVEEVCQVAKRNFEAALMT